MSRDAVRLGKLAEAHGLRVSVAESLTSGALSTAVGAVEGAGQWYAGAVIAYLTDVKERVLGLPPGTDPVSGMCAEQLARGAREMLDADLCVSTTGVGGPGSQGGHPEGTVFLGWASRHEAGHHRLALDGEPEEIIDATVAAAVSLLTSLAEGLHSGGPQRVREPAG